MTQETNNQTQQSQSHQTTTDQQDQKPKQKRTRKTIEQELAELEARKQKLLENKRKAEAHNKIIFGATVIAMLKEMQKEGDENGKAICELIENFAHGNNLKDYEIVHVIVEKLIALKPEKN